MRAVPGCSEAAAQGTRAQKLKKQRSTKAKRNTKVLYQLQHLLKCGECGRNFHARSSWTTTSVRNGKSYQYELATPRRYYMCNGMQGMRLRCREKPYIRAEQLEEPIWSEVKRVLQNPDLIVARKCDHLRRRQEALAAAKGELGRVKRMRLFRRLLTLGLWRI